MLHIPINPLNFFKNNVTDLACNTEISNKDCIPLQEFLEKTEKHRILTYHIIYRQCYGKGMYVRTLQSNYDCNLAELSFQPFFVCKSHNYIYVN